MKVFEKFLNFSLKTVTTLWNV